MGNKFNAYKSALDHVFTEIKKQGWLALLISIISPIILLTLQGDITNAFLFLVTIIGSFVLIIFIWSFFYILEEYGKTLLQKPKKVKK